MNTLHKDLSADFKVEPGKRQFIATITTDAVDRDREVLLPDGMIDKEFKKNPVVLWNHNADAPIGKAVGLRRMGDAWSAKAQLAERPETHVGEWLPDTIHALMQQGVVRGVSVGLIPEPGHRRMATSKDKDMFGESVESVITRWKLTEFSVTPTPANQEALISAVSKGAVSQETVKKMFGIDLKGKKPKSRKKKVTVFVFNNLEVPVGPRLDMARVIDKSMQRLSGQIYLTNK